MKKKASILFTRLFHINMNHFILFLNENSIIDHFLFKWGPEALKPIY